MCTGTFCLGTKCCGTPNPQPAQRGGRADRGTARGPRRPKNSTSGKSKILCIEQSVRAEKNTRKPKFSPEFLQAEPSVKAVDSNYLGVELHFTPERLSKSVRLKIVKMISAKFAYPISVILHHSLRFKIAKIISAKFAYPIFWHLELSQVMYCMEEVD